MARQRIIIVGGGFAGVKCAQTLRSKLPPERAEITLFNEENHLVFSPLLAEVVGSSLSPLDVVVPLRQALPGVRCRTESVCGVRLEEKAVEFEAENGGTGTLPYDHLVLAGGNVTNLNVVPGMADHAFPLKSVADATALRSHIMQQMEKAEVCNDSARRRWHLSFLIVGGGFSGVEAAGEINDLVRDSACYFQNFRGADAKVCLIHGRDQLLQEITPDLREFARRKLERAGVEIRLNARVALATPDGVGLEGGEFLHGATIICTIGSAPSPLHARLPVRQERGRLLTQADMRVQEQTNIWAIGDCALIINAEDGQPSPTTGQFAERQGRQCAANLIRILDGQPTLPFRYKPMGQLCSLGGHSAVAEFQGLHLSGFLAWFVWRGVYLLKLPTWGRRVQVGFDWAWLLIFPRDLAHIRTRPTDRVTQAHYRAGDVIIARGDPPAHFYVIKKGEVEVVRTSDADSRGEVIAILGAGSFFGERALLSDEPRVANVRARTDVDVLVLGRNVFTQISGALAPFRDALAQALNRRAVNPWRDFPKAEALLKKTPVRDLMEPNPHPLLRPDMPLSDARQVFLDSGHEALYVSSDGQTLEGVITITDLLRPEVRRAGEAPLTREAMTPNPVAIELDDSAALAASALREYRLKALPVVSSKADRKLVGCLRARRLLAYVLRHVGDPPEPPEGAG